MTRSPAGLIVIGVLLILAGVFLAPLLPIAGLAAFLKYALIIVGVVAGLYGVYLLVAAGPRYPG